MVIATGVHSFFGKAAHLVDSTEVIGHFQKVITNKPGRVYFMLKCGPDLVHEKSQDTSHYHI